MFRGYRDEMNTTAYLVGFLDSVGAFVGAGIFSEPEPSRCNDTVSFVLLTHAREEGFGAAVSGLCSHLKTLAEHSHAWQSIMDKTARRGLRAGELP